MAGNKVEGIVEEINLRSTRIRTLDDSVVTLPNSNLIKASVENFGARRVRRQRLSVRVASDTDPASLSKFVDAVREHLQAMKRTQKGRSIVELTEVGEASLGVLGYRLAQYWVPMLVAAPGLKSRMKGWPVLASSLSW